MGLGIAEHLIHQPGVRLVVVTRRGDDFEERSVLPVRFVPMTGEVRRKKP